MLSLVHFYFLGIVEKEALKMTGLPKDTDATKAPNGQSWTFSTKVNVIQNIYIYI